MHSSSWIQLAIFFSALALATKYLGSHLYKVLHPKEKPFLSSIIGPIEKMTYKFARIDTRQEHSWKEYLISAVLFSCVGILLVFTILRLQGYLPFNPENFGPPSISLALNIAIGFATNTDWQSYAGEATLSAFSQMTALAVQNFVSPAIGLCVAAALVRGIASRKVASLGNFWVDLIRIIYYVLLPLSILLAVFFLSQGVPQNFQPYTHLTTLDAGSQVIAQGPIASQEAIKILGSNGGGYTNMNSAHPFENPTPLSNFVQIFFMLLIPASQIYYFGKSISNKKHGWSIFTGVSLLFVIGLLFLSMKEASSNPILSLLSIDPVLGNMEGKEMRLGIFGSTFFTATSSVTSNGALNSSVDSYLPLGGMMALLNIQLGETIFGGIGSGLYNVLLIVLISLYLAGLIAGRMPVYLGKKIEIFDIKMTMCAIFIYIFTILAFTAWATVSPWGTSVTVNKGPHGFTEILYAFSSAAGNNGSSFLGSSTNTTAYNLIIGLVMLIGRFGLMIPVLALADSLNKKKIHPETEAGLSLSGPAFTLLFVGILLIIGALSYLPSLIIGPILEHMLMYEGSLF